MASLTSLLTATPTTPPTYNVGMAETFSWVPIEGAGRPLYARATYLANPSDIKVSLSAGDLTISTSNLEALVSTSNTIAKQLTANTDNIESLFVSSNTLLNVLTGKDATVNTEFLETYLDVLTAVDYATANKQDSQITLLQQLTANSNSIEGLLQTSNSLLNSISAKDVTVNLDLSAIDVNTDGIEMLLETSNTLLNALTGKTTSIDVAGVETRLDVLTAVSYASETKQNTIITLLHAITGTAIEVDLNTDQLELHVDGVETKLDVLTATNFATEANQTAIITLLDSLTAKHTTVNLDVSAISINTDQIKEFFQKSNTLLNELTASNKYVPGFLIPPYDEINFEYVGTTDIFRKVTYLNNSTQVMALSFIYTTEPPTTGNAIIQTVKKI